MPKLSDLDFTDLYVRLDQREPSRYAPVPRRGSTLPRNVQVPPEFEEEINYLRGQLERQEHDDFALDLDDMRIRGSRCDIFGSQKWVAIRKLSLDPPKLDELGFRPEVMDAFRAWGSRSGLVVIGGATRAGKTTTAVGLLRSYLEAHGGVAYTVEDPVEFYMQGDHGPGGYCFQREVHADEQWGESVKTALRWAPRYIFLGEVRTPGAAKWLLRAATSGHLALCTVHGGSIEETLSAILQVAQAEMGDTAMGVLADGLCAVVHQSLQNGRPNVQILSAGSKQGDQVRSIIRSGKLQMMGTLIEQQSARRRHGQDDEVGQGSGAGGAFGAKVAAPEPQAAPASPPPARVEPRKKGWFG